MNKLFRNLCRTAVDNRADSWGPTRPGLSCGNMKADEEEEWDVLFILEYLCSWLKFAAPESPLLASSGTVYAKSCSRLSNSKCKVFFSRITSCVSCWAKQKRCITASRSLLFVPQPFLFLLLKVTRLIPPSTRAHRQPAAIVYTADTWDMQFVVSHVGVLELSRQIISLSHQRWLRASSERDLHPSAFSSDTLSHTAVIKQTYGHPGIELSTWDVLIQTPRCAFTHFCGETLWQSLLMALCYYAQLQKDSGKWSCSSIAVNSFLLNVLAQKESGWWHICSLLILYVSLLSRNSVCHLKISLL